MRESKKQKAERIKAALAALKEAYPDAKPELNFTSPFELLVATMLSAQCTDKQVNKTTAVLFPLYNTPEAFASLSEEELAPYIRSCGFYQTKGKNIIAASKIIVEQYGGQVPRGRDELTKLPGVGRKTANVVVSNAFGVPGNSRGYACFPRCQPNRPCGCEGRAEYGKAAYAEHTSRRIGLPRIIG